MPQMAPLNWLTLFAYTTVIFILFNLVNYYSILYRAKTIKKETSKISYNWKW